MQSLETAKTEYNASVCYDDTAHRLGLYPEFYTFVAEACNLYRVPVDASVVDVGCGTGLLLAELRELGYSNLSAVDFSVRCIDLARARVLLETIQVHDIQDGPLRRRFDVVFMTEVVEHLTNPVDALCNVHDSLVDGGWLFLTFPNRLAFFPWYYLQPLISGLHWWPWLQRWAQWFMVPYEMRSDQPVDHAYSPREVTRLLQYSGFVVIGARGMRLLPMLRIPGLGWTEKCVRAIERGLGRLLPRWLTYRYMLICRKRLCCR